MIVNPLDPRSRHGRRGPRKFAALAALAAAVLALTQCSRHDAPAAAGTETPAAAETTLLISNARVVDGTGAPAQPGTAVRIRGDRIVEVGALTPAEGETVIDAGGKVLAPGFIDTHSHHDGGLDRHREAMAAVSQGITTIVVGQDGGSQPLAKLFGHLEQQPAAVNVASYVGHNSVRAEVMGEDFRRQATPEEIERMRQRVAEELQQGALGLSTGLEYDPGIYSSHEEVVTLAQEAAKAGGRYISHMRSEDREVWKALDEIIEIGRRTRMPVQISHMKLAMTDWWGQADRFLGLLDKARAEGIDITGDVYPYEYWQSGLSVLFPERDFGNRKTAEFVLRSLAPPDGLIVTSFAPDPTLVGKTVAQISEQRGTDPAATVMWLLAEGEKGDNGVGVIGTSMHADDVAKFIAWPHSNICSDGGLDGLHPRGAGAFTRVLREYVREKHVLTLEQAVRKMSGAGAEHVGLADRGVIRAGAYADLVLFDPDTVADRATLETPVAPSVGIDKVWVNGVVVLDNGNATGAYPGRPLRRGPQSGTAAASPTP